MNIPRPLFLATQQSGAPLSAYLRRFTLWGCRPLLCIPTFSHGHARPRPSNNPHSLHIHSSHARYGFKSTRPLSRSYALEFSLKTPCCLIISNFDNRQTLIIFFATSPLQIKEMAKLESIIYVLRKKWSRLRGGFDGLNRTWLIFLGRFFVGS